MSGMWPTTVSDTNASVSLFLSPSRTHAHIPLLEFGGTALKATTYIIIQVLKST